MYDCHIGSRYFSQNIVLNGHRASNQPAVLSASSETSSTSSTVLELKRSPSTKHAMNGTQVQQLNASTGRSESPVFSDTEADDIHDDDHPGDYSTRLGEVMSDEEDSSGAREHEGDENDDEEAFFYSGVDAEPAGTYREQLRDVLGPEHEEDDTSDAQEVEHSLLVHEKEILESSMDDEARVSRPHKPLPLQRPIRFHHSLQIRLQTYRPQRRLLQSSSIHPQFQK